MDYTSRYIEEAMQILHKLDHEDINRIVTLLCDVRGRGARIFFMGVGGGAGHASESSELPV